MKRFGGYWRWFWVGLLLLPCRPGAAQLLAADTSPWPEWEGAAFALGGAWDDALPGWRTAPDGAGALCLALERGVERGVVLALWHRGAVTLELLDAAGETRAAMSAGERLAAGGGFAWSLYALPRAAPGSGLLLSGAGEAIEIVAALLLEPAALASGDGNATPPPGARPRPGRDSLAASTERTVAPVPSATLPAPATLTAGATPGRGAEAAAALPARASAMPRLTLLAPAPGARLLW